MCKSLPLHSLNTAYAAALAAGGTSSVRLHSLCMGNLDECALAAARDALEAAGCQTGLTVNDSLTVARDRPACLPSHEVLRLGRAAAAERLGYDVTFKYLAELRKPDESPPTLASVATALKAASPVLGADPSTPVPSRSPSPDDGPRSHVPSPDPPLASLPAPYVLLPVCHPDVEIGDTGASCLPPSARRAYPAPLRVGAVAPSSALLSSTELPVVSPPDTAASCTSSPLSRTSSPLRPTAHPSPLPPAPYYMPIPPQPPSPFMVVPITPVDSMPSWCCAHSCVPCSRPQPLRPHPAVVRPRPIRATTSLPSFTPPCDHDFPTAVFVQPLAPALSCRSRSPPGSCCTLRLGTDETIRRSATEPVQPTAPGASRAAAAASDCPSGLASVAVSTWPRYSAGVAALRACWRGIRSWASVSAGGGHVSAGGSCVRGPFSVDAAAGSSYLPAVGACPSTTTCTFGTLGARSIGGCTCELGARAEAGHHTPPHGDT
jgi:hypothetical protein